MALLKALCSALIFIIRMSLATVLNYQYKIFRISDNPIWYRVFRISDSPINYKVFRISDNPVKYKIFRLSDNPIKYRVFQISDMQPYQYKVF